MNITGQKDACLGSAHPQFLDRIESSVSQSVINNDMTDIPPVDRNMDCRSRNRRHVIFHAMLFHHGRVSDIDVSPVDKRTNTASRGLFHIEHLDVGGISAARGDDRASDRVDRAQLRSAGQEKQLAFADAFREDVLDPILSFRNSSCFIKDKRFGAGKRLENIMSFKDDPSCRAVDRSAIIYELYTLDNGIELGNRQDDSGTCKPGTPIPR